MPEKLLRAARHYMAARKEFPFGAGNAFDRSTEGFVAPIAHFDKNKRAPVAHDQIDLAETASVVAVQQSESAPGQKFRGSLLRQCSALAHRACDPSSSLAVPCENCAGTSVRMNWWALFSAMVPVTPSSGSMVS